MKSSTVIDTKDVDAMFARIGKQLSKDIVKALDVTAQKGITMILDRTAKGNGYSRTFSPYSPQYSKAKAEGWPKTQNRSAFSGDPSGKVNLNVTGRMLASIKRKMDKINMTAEIGFNRAPEAAKGYWNNQRRPFFGFNQREKTYLRKFFYGIFTK